MVATREKSETARIGGLAVRWRRGILEPRPWTAEQAAWADELLGDAPEGPVLELCSGAGHIGLLAVRGHRERRLVAVDRSPLACRFARDNARRAGLADRVEVRCGDLGRVVGTEERFAVVIADPPWVPRPRLGLFPQDPVEAIDGGPDGLHVARRCVRVAERHLAPGGCCLLQLGDCGQVELLGRWLRGRQRPGRARMTILECRGHGTDGLVIRLARPAPGGPPC